MQKKQVLGIVSIIIAVAALAFGSAWAITSQGRQADQAALLAQRQELDRVLARVDMLEQKVRRLDLNPPGVLPDERPLARPAPPAHPPVGAGALGAPPAHYAQGTPPSGGVVLDPLDPEAAPQVREAIQGFVRDELAIAREERRVKRAERMKQHTVEEISEFAKLARLDKESETQLVEHISTEREKMMTIWQEARESDTPREQLQQKMKTLRAETDHEVSAILDEDQYKLYTEKRAEELERFGQGRRGRGGGGNRGRGRSRGGNAD